MTQRFHVATGSGGLVLPVADGDYFTGEMPANYQSGQCYIQFYSDADGLIPVTPAAGTIEFRGSPIAGQYLIDPAATTIAATGVIAGNATYTPPVFAGAVIKGKMTLAGITGALSCRAHFWRR